MKRILHIIGYLGRGGDTTVVLDVMKAMDRSKFHFDFVTHEGTTKMDIVQMLRDQGCTVYILKGDVRKLGPIKYYKELLKILRTANVKYDAVHAHTGMQSGIALLAAKKAGIPVRICHSHVTTIQRKVSGVKKMISVPVLRHLYGTNATQKVACSKMAGDFLFGENSDYRLLYNAVDTERYLAVTKAEVDKVRDELGVSEDDVLIGHVARISPMKNQRFTVSLAKELREIPDLKFVIVGDGQEYDEIRNLAHGYSNIILTGQRSDIPVLMKSFDCVILPSLPGEGFPVTMMEAQAAGCRCMISDHVTTEVEVGLQLVDVIPLKDKDAWVKNIRQIQRNTDINLRNKKAEALAGKGFGKKEFVNKWLDLYE